MTTPPGDGPRDGEDLAEFLARLRREAEPDFEVPSPATTERAARASRGHEEARDRDDLDVSQDATGPRFFGWLLVRAPFGNLFTKYAEILYANEGDKSPAAQFMLSHRWFLWTCLILDVAVRLLVVVLLVAAAVAVTWKTLAPLPAFWDKSP